MLEKINKRYYEELSLPNEAFVSAVSRRRREVGLGPMAIAEVGVGIGASALAVSRLLCSEDSYYLFDYVDKVKELVEDLESALSTRPVFVLCGATRHTRDSYVFNLAELVLLMRAREEKLFDVVLLDGAHDLTIDLAACLLIVELIKPGGYVVLDNPSFKYKDVTDRSSYHQNRVSLLYSEKQQQLSQVKLVDDLFLSRLGELNKVLELSSSDNTVYQKRMLQC